MKQLLHQFTDGSRSYYVVALQDRAFVGVLSNGDQSSGKEATTKQPLNAALIELQRPPAVSEDAAESESNMFPPGQIQAVAGHAVKETRADGQTYVIVYAAVSRCDKSLAVYCLDSLSNKDMTSALPSTVHHASKRSSCLCFARVPASKRDNAAITSDSHVLIAGDLVGDAFAYSLEHGSSETAAKETEEELHCPYRRLLVGHTASMLTCVKVNPQNHLLITADRDEKIRLSSFPNTDLIQGFLLGHDAYVSDFSVHGNRCVSCGGDRALRIWDYEACRELASLDLSTLDKFAVSGVPNKVSLAQTLKGDLHITVMYEDSKNLHVFVFREDEEESPLTEMTQLSLPSCPLAISMVNDTTVMVLLHAPDYLRLFNLDSESSMEFDAVNKVARDAAIAMPQSVLEKDKSGNITMAKNAETRGPAKQMPWNDVKRKELQRGRNQRRHETRNNKRPKKQDQGETVEEA